MNATYTVIQRSSVNNSDPGQVRGEFATRDEAAAFIRENTVDGLNVSGEPECDYLMVEGEDD